MDISEYNKTGAELLLRDIELGVVPKEVYKYRSICQVERFLDDCKLYFAKPSQFNDPFEGKYYFESSQDAFTTMTKKCSSDLVISQMGIFCVGIDPANLIMWSHYCDFHKGATIGFDMTKDIDFFAGSMPVIYHGGFLRFRNIRTNFCSSLQHKFIEWGHEKEVRTIKPISELMKIKPQAVTTITFGAKSADADIERIKKKVATSRFRHIVFKKCVLDENDYKLNVVEL